MATAIYANPDRVTAGVCFNTCTSAAAPLGCSTGNTAYSDSTAYVFAETDGNQIGAFVSGCCRYLPPSRTWTANNDRQTPCASPRPLITEIIKCKQHEPRRRSVAQNRDCVKASSLCNSPIQPRRRICPLNISAPPMDCDLSCIQGQPLCPSSRLHGLLSRTGSGSCNL